LTADRPVGRAAALAASSFAVSFSKVNRSVPITLGRCVFRVGLCVSITVAAPAVAGDDEPGGGPRTPIQASTQEKLKELAGEVSQTANQYGPDAATIRAGAEGPTEVAVEGVFRAEGEDWLRYRVLTGLVLTGGTENAAARVDRIWRAIAEPALKGLKTLETEPASIQLDFLYASRPLAPADDAAAAGLPDRVVPEASKTLTMRLSGSVLEEFSSGVIAAQDLRDRAELSGPDVH
jgi:hypothetical protein